MDGLRLLVGGAMGLLNAASLQSFLMSSLLFYQPLSEEAGTLSTDQLVRHLNGRPGSPPSTTAMQAIRDHESPRRGGNFVTMKIVNGVKDVVDGKEDCIRLGNLYSKRDWGHSKDYVKGMWLMLQADKPDDYVLATGETTSVKEFVNMAFAQKGVELMWYHSGLKEVAIDTASMKVVVRVDPKYFRPCEVDLLLGDSTKAHEQLGWTPEHDLKSLVVDMFMNR